MPLDTHVFDPSACGFPAPRLPLLPTGVDWLLSRRPAGKPPAPAGTARTFSRGRYALHEAYRLAGLDGNSALLAPAYHCRTMLDPALALDAHVILYPLRADLSIDLPALDELARNPARPIRALLATHYFGFPKDLARVAEWCRARRIALIEDCSHTFVTERLCPKGVGSHGDFVVSSPYKFFPSPDGGLLLTRAVPATEGPPIRRPDWSAEFRAFKRVLEAARRNDRRPDIDRLPEELAAILARPANCAQEICRPEGPSSTYQAQEESLEALRLSRLIQRRANIIDIARRRRHNYRRLCEGLAGLPHCRPLYPRLPDHCVPYMLPLLIDQPDPHFFHLKHLGVPIWRWDSMAASGCQTANDYRLRLLHLPCHQSLRPAQIEWMIEAVCLVMASNPPEPPA